MKKIGLVAGLGPEATVDYYKKIIDAFKTQGNDLKYPEIIMYSVNMWEFLTPMKSKNYEKVLDYLLGKINALKAAGADFIALTANTPHLLFDKLKERTDIPMLSIVEAACRETERNGFRRPALFGTGFTMRNKFYQDVFGSKNIDIIVPDENQIEFINQKLFSEIELGIFKDETRNALVDIMTDMKNTHHIDSVILGCTEFPLVFTEPSYAGLPMLDTTAIHVKEIVEYCVS